MREHPDERVPCLVSLPCRGDVADHEDRAARALPGALVGGDPRAVLDRVGGDLEPAARLTGEARLDRARAQPGTQLRRPLEPGEHGVEIGLLERPEHPPGGAVRERDDAIPVDDDDPLADRADDRVELRGPRPFRADQLGEAGLVGQALAERGGEAGPLPVTLVLGVLPAGDVVEGVDRELEASGTITQGHGADDGPALLARGPDPEANGLVARRLAPQDARAGQAARIERPAVLVEELESSQDGVAAGRQELVGRIEAAGLCRRVVGVDDPPIERLDGDPIGHDVDDLAKACRVEALERRARMELFRRRRLGHVASVSDPISAADRPAPQRQRRDERQERHGIPPAAAVIGAAAVASAQPGRRRPGPGGGGSCFGGLSCP